MKKLIAIGVLSLSIAGGLIYAAENKVQGAPFPECTNCISELHVPIIIDGVQTAELHVPIIIDGVVKA